MSDTREMNEPIQIPPLPKGTRLMWHVGTPHVDRIEPIALVGLDRDADLLVCHFLRPVSLQWYEVCETGLGDRIITETREEALELSRIAREKYAARFIPPAG